MSRVRVYHDCDVPLWTLCAAKLLPSTSDVGKPVLVPGSAAM